MVGGERTDTLSFLSLTALLVVQLEGALFAYAPKIRS